MKISLFMHLVHVCPVSPFAGGDLGVAGAEHETQGEAQSQLRPALPHLHRILCSNSIFPVIPVKI